MSLTNSCPKKCLYSGSGLAPDQTRNIPDIPNFEAAGRDDKIGIKIASQPNKKKRD